MINTRKLTEALEKKYSLDESWEEEFDDEYDYIMDDDSLSDDEKTRQVKLLRQKYDKKNESLNESFWDPTHWFDDLVDNYENWTSEEWNTWSQEKRDMEVTKAIKHFLIDNQLSEEEALEFIDDLDDNNFHTEARIFNDLYNRNNSLVEASHAKKSLVAVVTDVFKGTKFKNVKVTKERGGVRVDFDKLEKPISEQTADNLAQRIELISGDTRISVYPDVVGDNYIIFDISYLAESLTEARNPENDEVNAIIRKHLGKKSRISKKEQEVLDRYNISRDDEYGDFIGPNGKTLMSTGRKSAQGPEVPVKYGQRGRKIWDWSAERSFRDGTEDSFNEVDYANYLTKEQPGEGQNPYRNDLYYNRRDLDGMPYSTPSEDKALRPYSDTYKDLKDILDKKEYNIEYNRKHKPMSDEEIEAKVAEFRAQLERDKQRQQEWDAEDQEEYNDAKKALDDFRASIPRR